MKYCPNCGCISEKSFSATITCTMCNFTGKPYEGSIDQINAFRRRVKNGNHRIEKIPEVKDSHPNDPAKDMTIGELSKKLQGMKGKSTDDFEFL